MTQKSGMQADQTSQSSSAKHDIQAVAGTQVATPQVTGTQAGESKKEKQFKIKKVKNKRMQQVASSSGNGFFRNKGGSGHRKMSAANKRGAAALKKAPAAADPQAQPLDQTEDGKEGASMSYLECFIQQHKQREEEKRACQDEAANEASQVIAEHPSQKPKTPEPTVTGAASAAVNASTTKNFSEYKLLFHKNSTEKVGQAQPSQ